MLINLNQLLPELENNENLKAGDCHQAILDVCYDHWNKDENKGWSYVDMANFARFRFGDLIQFLLLAGKYNQQITNGGHCQYYENGYASGKDGYEPRRVDTNSLHHEMMTRFKELKLDQHPIGKEVFKIQERFYRMMYDWTPPEDEGEPYFPKESDELDTKYFELNDEWMEYLNSYAKEFVHNKTVGMRQ